MSDEQINKLIHEKIMGECSHNMAFARAYGFEVGCPMCHERYNHLYRIPDYCTDLNAVALAEAKVVGDDLHKAIALATCIASLLSGREMTAFATARQRAEACLRAVDLWEDGRNEG